MFYNLRTWIQVKAGLTSSFVEVTDSQHALMLRKVKQKPGENVQVYVERLLGLAEDAFVGLAGPAADSQLMITWKWRSCLKIRLLCKRPLLWLQTKF